MVSIPGYVVGQVITSFTNLLLPLKIVIWPTIVLVFFSAGDQFSISVNPSYNTSITLNLSTNQ